MRKLIICTLLLCSTFALSQQWTTVASVSLFGQTNAIPLTTLMTPSEPGIYRIVTYLSVTGGNNIIPGFFHSAVYAQDVGDPTGNIYQFTETCAVGGNNSVPAILSLKPGVPLTYEVDGQNAPEGCTYNFVLTVEQFIPQSK